VRIDFKGKTKKLNFNVKIDFKGAVATLSKENEMGAY